MHAVPAAHGLDEGHGLFEGLAREEPRAVKPPQRARHREAQGEVAELHREGPSYTADTMKALRALYPAAEFFLIIGQDALIDLPGWRSPQGILDEARLLVLPRPSEERPIPSALAGYYEMLPFEESLMSSTEVRRRLAEGDPALDCLSPAVLEIVKERGLYHAHR